MCIWPWICIGGGVFVGDIGGFEVSFGARMRGVKVGWSGELGF